MMNWRSSTPVSAVPPTPAKSETPVATTPGTGTPRRVPAGVEVTDYNAQKFYSTKECLFVANLPLDPYDHDLQAELVDIFKVYGVCYIKVQRDIKRMPQAFVQYTCRQDAERAMDATKNLVIRGRNARIEWSKANREYHLSRKDGAVVSEEAARQFLAPFGAIETVAIVDKAAFNAGLSTSGVLVTFENYQSGRDAVKQNQDSDEWCVIEHDRDGARKKTALAESMRSKRSEAEIENYAIDRKSIFLGNLRDTTNEHAIRELCKEFGKVISVDIYIRPSTRDGCDKNVFAYIEFTNPEEVKAAIGGLRGRPYKGQRLKVDQKKSPEILYGKDSRDGKNATPAQMDKWAQLPRNGVQVAPSPMGQFGVGANGQNAVPASPFPPAPYGTPIVGFASPYNANPPAYASPGHGFPAAPMNSPYGAQPNFNYGSPAPVYGHMIPAAGGREAFPPNAPHPTPGQPHFDIQSRSIQEIYGTPTPPNSSLWPYNPYGQQMYGGPHYQQYYGQQQPQQQLYPRTPSSTTFQPSAPSPLAPPADEAPFGKYPRPSAMYTHDIRDSLLEPNAQCGVQAGSAATAQETAIHPGNHAYGRELDLPDVGKGATLSPKKLNAPNQPCSISDMIGATHDDDIVADAVVEAVVEAIAESGIKDDTGTRPEAPTKVQVYSVKNGANKINQPKQFVVDPLMPKRGTRAFKKAKAARKTAEMDKENASA